MSSEAERLRAALTRIDNLLSWPVDEGTIPAIQALVTAALAPPQPTPDTRPTLTPRQAEVLAYIRESIARKGYSPSFREVQDAFGFKGPSGVVCHANALEKKGYLRWSADTARSFVLLEAS